jgi:hypothetical protein
MFPELGKSTAYMKFARLRPLVQELYYGEHEHGNGGMILTGESRSIGRETYSNPNPYTKISYGRA